jgi:CRISPR-associated endonuclease/helicase Cas3
LLAPAIFGHHGRPVILDETPPSAYQEPEVRASRECGIALLRLLLPTPIDAEVPDTRRACTASWWLSGLVTLADWIGSNQDWFPYESATHSMGEYWQIARERAQRAVREAGVVSPTAAPSRSFQDLTGLERSPTPLQRWAASVSLPPGPVLILIEDVTGAGKSEAAQILVHRFMAEGRASGAYWAMPTQATANAMYDRNRESIEALFASEPGHPLSLVLAHGQARLNERFTSTVLGSASRASRETGSGGGPVEEEMPSSIACAAFLADDRRSGMLADVGVGTVDQAMLGALPSRFNTMRLFGLSDKIVVFDEVHAYDPYMQEEAVALLAFQAALGGSAVVLSATLARKQREKLVNAWTRAANGRKRSGPLFSRSIESPAQGMPADRVPYPMTTLVHEGESGVMETALASADWSFRTVPVRLISDERRVLDVVCQAAKTGAACAWVRNTVDDCVAAAALLREQGIEALVFHARFAQVDRQAREATILQCFGKTSSGAARGKVLVATQVIEQSLDLDFDVMVTDVAPVDLLIQRAGRLWRHSDRERPAGVEREFVILAPPFEEAPDEHWLKSFLPGTNAVYKDVGVVWRTVRALDRARKIITPGAPGEEGGIRWLVEAVYGDMADVPEKLRRRSDAATGEALSASAVAIQTTLKVTDGYHGGAQAWVSDMRVRTRLGDEPTVVRLASVLENGELRPWAHDGELAEWKAWALSEVRVSGRRIPFDAAVLPEFTGQASALRATWGRFEQGIVLLPLAQDKDRWSGGLVKKDGNVLSFEYSTSDGLLIPRG